MHVIDGVTDAELIGRAVGARDTAAFGTIIGRYQTRIHGYVWRLCRDDSVADDLTQDTFLTAWKQLGKFRGDGSFEGWLLRIAHTTFLQAIRKQKRRREESLDAANAHRLEAELAADVSQADDMPDLDRLLAALDPEIRGMMILAYGLGLTLAEIAAVVRMPVGTVKSHLSRAKSRLRDEFALEGAA